MRTSGRSQYEHRLDANQEVFALGAASSLGALFQAYTPCASLSRSAVLAAAGARTQAANAVQVGAMLLVLALLTPCFEYVCRAALGAVVVAAFTSIIGNMVRVFCLSFYCYALFSHLLISIWPFYCF